VLTDHNKKGTKLDEIADLIRSLKETIAKQNTTIENIRTELTEIKAEQKSLKSQNSELHETILTLQTQLNTYQCPPQPTRSWASIAASGNATESGANRSGVTSPVSRNNEPKCLRISTKPSHDSTDGSDTTFTRYLPTELANTHIRNALMNTDSTKDVQVAGVGTTKTGYVIRFKDQCSADTAKANTEWLKELGNGTKMVKPRFGVVVHRTPTEDFSLPDNEAQGIQKIMEDNNMAANGHNIQEIAWLKSKGKELGRSASLGIWFDTAEAAEWITNNGLLIGQRYIGSIEPYQIKKKRCHRCQASGHLAWTCKERIRCGFCTGEHDRRDCPPDAIARCVDCNGAHPTGDRECRGQTTINSTQ
jgi:hypothetical protein